jgi:N-acetylglucosamine transport system permease protein
MKLRTRSRERSIFIIAVTFPIVSLYILFYIFPCIRGLYMSLFSWRGISLKMTFAGLQNFADLFQDRAFFQALTNNLYIFLFSSVLLFVFSIFFAVILSRNLLPERNVYRTIFFFPATVPLVVVGVISMSVYAPTTGILNTFLEAIGLGSLKQLWFSNKNLVLPSLGSFLVWKVLGFYLVLLIAAIQNIPTDLYESATLDGARTWQQTTRITLPLIWEVVRTLLVFFIISSFAATFGIIFMTTRGGPDRASDVLVTYMYESAFTFYKFGYGTAIGVMILVITVVMALVILRTTRREVVQY